MENLYNWNLILILYNSVCLFGAKDGRNRSLWLQKEQVEENRGRKSLLRADTARGIVLSLVFFFGCKIHDWKFPSPSSSGLFLWFLRFHCCTVLCPTEVLKHTPCKCFFLKPWFSICHSLWDLKCDVSYFTAFPVEVYKVSVGSHTISQ